MNSEDQIRYIRHHLRKPVVIIGMMGAGKTTLGRKISERLEWPFFDSDQEIEKDEKTSVKKMFETRGETYFRQKEKEKIAELLCHTGHIISVGGGAVTHPETARAIFKDSICLWVDAPIEILVKRTAHQGGRPLLNGRDAEEALTERMQERKSLYMQAHLHVDGASSIEDVTDNAIGQIYKYLL